MTPIGGGDGFKLAPSCNHVVLAAPACRVSQSGAGMLRALLFAAMIAPLCFDNVADAQTSGPIVSEPCKGAQRVSLPELDRKIRSLEALVKNLKSTRSQVSPQARSKLQEIDEKLRTNQETLIDLAFTRECLRKDVQPDPTLLEDAKSGDGRRGLANWVAITTYYATNRLSTGASGGITAYGSERIPQPEYGRTEVSIPTSRRPGELPLPSLWRLEFSPDPDKHFVLRSVQPLKNDVARTELSAKLASTDSKSVLIFVHGFNVSFTDAALRTAQLAHDLAFPGLAMFFAWPSAAATRSYFRDEEVAQLSVPALNQLLDDVAALNPTDIFLIAHSLGNRVVTSALRERVIQRQPVPKISELLLAAPDINEQIFSEQIVPALAGIQTMRRTIYASGSDVALKASKYAHEFRRVGDTVGGVLTFAGYDTIDASAAAPMVRSYGHSYVMDSARVLSDIFEILIRRKPAAERGLDLKQSTPNSYWLLR
jgi:esterase/lipase superfamily enzyme